MESGLRTEEFGKKKNTTKIMIILLLLIVIITIALCTYYYITNKKKEEAKKKTIEVTSLNEELQDIYGFAISNNYIVALKNNGSMIKIYNLLQGTGNLGDFTYYTYYNDKLYLLFEDNNLYTISLTDGNKVYELTKNLTLENLQCSSNNIGKTSDLAFSGKTIYFNTSSCGISRLSYDAKTKKAKISLLCTFVAIVIVYIALQHDLFGISKILNRSYLNDRVNAITSNNDSFFATDRWKIKEEYIKNAVYYPWGGGRIRLLANNKYAHDLILDTYGEGGVFSCALLVIYLYLWIKSIIKFTRNSNSLEVKVLFIPFVVVVLIQMTLEPILEGAPVFMLSFVMMDGIIAKANRMRNEHESCISV